MPYDLPPLPYAYSALEPAIDAETMELHHAKHHRAYVDALNKALEPYPDLHGRSIEGLLRDLDAVPEAIRQTVRDQGGGHANHQLFWKVVQPGGAKAPAGTLLAAMDGAFGGFDSFKARFEEAAVRHFGSGWAFLCTGARGEGLEIVTLPNQDSVLGLRKPALLANDLWEHAYYLKHRDRRTDYLRGWWEAVNWTTVGDRLEAVRAGEEQRLGGPAR